MSRRLRRAPAWTLLVALVVLATLAAAAAARPPDPDSGTVVGARGEADAASLVRTLRAAGWKPHPVPRIHAIVVKGVTPDAVRALLGSDARVRWIEPILLRTLLAEPAAAVDPTTGRAFDWAYDAVDAGPALAAAGGGSPVRVAVVDSGVDATHPDLAGRVAPATDIALEQQTAPDLVGHGTFVAGLISAIDGNGIGGRGVAGVTTVIPIRVTTTGSITSANAAAGVVAAVDAGARVVNLSFGGPTLSAAERAALEYAASEDVLVVAAAGNSRQSGNPVVYPAAAVGGSRGGWSAGLSVGAVDPLGAAAPFSTSNDAVSVSAPGAGSASDCGDGIFSTIPQGQASLWDEGSCLRTVGSPGSPTGRYGYGEGTSFSAPLVAGAAALVRGVNSRLTAAQTADVIRRTAHQTVGTGWNSRTGVGVLDMAAAVSFARRYDTIAPTPVVAASPVAGGVSVTVTVKEVSSSAGEQSGLVGVHLESSADGVTYAPVGPDAVGILRLTDPIGAGARRWYRGTACDANHNCGSTTVGPVTAGAAATISSASGPAIALVSAARPRSCRACLQIGFTARGKGPLSWTADVGGAGVRAVHRSGALPLARRLTLQMPLSRQPVCGGRLGVALRLRSASGLAKAFRTLRVTTRCLKSRSARRYGVSTMVRCADGVRNLCRDRRGRVHRSTPLRPSHR